MTAVITLSLVLSVKYQGIPSFLCEKIHFELFLTACNRKRNCYILQGPAAQSTNIYILGVFTEKLYSKQWEHDAVYIPIITLSHATLHDFK